MVSERRDPAVDITLDSLLSSGMSAACARMSAAGRASAALGFDALVAALAWGGCSVFFIHLWHLALTYSCNMTAGRLKH